MSYTETTSESWFGRLGGAFKGILAGFVFVIIAVGLLFWNEGRTVKRYKALKEGEAAVVSIDSDSVDSKNEGKLVHLTGKAITKDVLNDDDFPVSVNAIQLCRTVEMYQWQEESTSQTKKKLGGGTETVTKYVYKKGWSSTAIDSTSFKEKGHDNPGMMPWESKNYFAKNVQLGAFTLNKSQIAQIGPAEEYKVVNPDNKKPEESSQSPVTNIMTADPGVIRLVAYEGTTDSSTISVTPDAQKTPADKVITINNQPNKEQADPAKVDNEKKESNEIRIINGGFYRGKDVQAPQIGDVRVSYRFVQPEAEISIISQQKGNALIPYQAKTGTVELLNLGTHSAEEMFKVAQSDNTFFAWLIRILGIIVMYFGFKAIVNPLAVMADVLPFLGSVVDFGSGIFCFCITLGISLITISIAWLYYRPWIGIPLLAVAIFLLILAFRRKRK